MEYLTLFALSILIGYFIGKYERQILNGFLEFCDIAFAYTKFVLLHRWNKLNERHIRFIEEADWTFGSETKHNILQKIKKLNKVP